MLEIGIHIMILVTRLPGPRNAWCKGQPQTHAFVLKVSWSHILARRQLQIWKRPEKKNGEAGAGVGGGGGACGAKDVRTDASCRSKSTGARKP